ncbi:amino acid adenylation domain-containing protein [Streptomyces sp. NPDC020681]|uniref:amino acid adenylation domain-containing protein n=1 Tax=Streptomyces sp. NPDC020681 TaxID=3365083 RepID=UPI0037A238E9
MIKLASRPTEEQVATVENVLAAHLVLIHRRTLQQHITVYCRLADADEERVGVVSVDFDDDLTVEAVARRAAAQLGGLVPEDSDEAAEAAATAVSGSFEVLRDGASADAALSGPVATVVLDGDAPHISVTAGAGGLVDGPAASVLEAALRAATDAVAHDPDTAVARLRLATVDESAHWLRLGHSDRRPPAARCIQELISERAALTPDAPAVTSGTEVLTYRQLNENAGRLAQKLRESGIAGDSVVAVLLSRSPQLVVTLLAILKAGGAYLALDPEDPRRRHEQVLRDSGAALLVTTRGTADGAVYGLPTLDPADLPTSGTAPAETETDAHASNPDALAYISYTSGSTGEPRGVGVPHRAVARLVSDPDWIDVSADDVFLQLAPVAFDASTWEIWAPLVHGARLAVAPPGVVEVDLLAETLTSERVTVVWLTAGLFHQMAALHLDAFAGLRHVVAGGDVISPSHLSRLLSGHPHLTFTNGYGPTENTTFTACWTTTTAPTGDTVPIGRPISGTHVAVLDADLRPVPPGVCGDLYAAGDGLARGYANRPAATAQSFVPDVISGIPGARMYRTGDLARWTPQGTLEFLGRADQQLKVQGFRVEPGSIEAELTRMEEVREAVVIGQPDDAGGKRLLAYVVLNEAAAKGTEDTEGIGARLREKLRATLPTAMVPWAVLIRTELPLNKNGKVDRRALPAATRVPRNVWNDFVAPRTEVQRRLADLWGDVLGVEPIGIEDDFFDLGGHSLLVAELLGTLKDTFAVDVPARVLYLQPTITDLADEIGG